MITIPNANRMIASKLRSKGLFETMDLCRVV
jgi:hypothetical protein